jgi:hypothetical protein
MNDKPLEEIEKDLEDINQKIRANKTRNAIWLSFIKSSPATSISSIAVGLTLLSYQKQFDINANYTIYPFLAAIAFIALAIVSWILILRWNKSIEADKNNKTKLEKELDERIERAKGKFEESRYFPPLSKNFQQILFDENAIILNKTPTLNDEYGDLIVRDMRYVEKDLVDNINKQREKKDSYFRDIVDFTREAKQQLDSMAKGSEMERAYFSQAPPVTMTGKIRALLLAYLYEINPQEYPNLGLSGKDLEFFGLLLQKDPSYEARDKYPGLMKMQELRNMAKRIESDRKELEEMSVQIDTEIGSKFLGRNWKRVVFN